MLLSILCINIGNSTKPKGIIYVFKILKIFETGTENRTPTIRRPQLNQK